MNCRILMKQIKKIQFLLLHFFINNDGTDGYAHVQRSKCYSLLLLARAPLSLYRATVATVLLILSKEIIISLKILFLISSKHD